ncbi:MAG TPA: sulfurtransferase [Pelomicrobium sp.]|nr:sulfurtransferase [Pelomicrobium sp.]
MAFTTLIDGAELAAHLDDPNWIVFDCRYDLFDHDAGTRAYAEGHVPGAHYLHLARDLSGVMTGANGRHPLPGRDAFAALMARFGVTPGVQAVAYDAGPGPYAARLWWMLRWLGHRDVAVLDGGFARWVAEGRPVSAAIPQARPAPFEPGAGDRPVAADDVEAHLAQPDQLILDARSPDRFRGENETLDPVGGHIPGAVNRFFMTNLGEDGRFKPAAKLGEEFRAVLGNADPQTVVHQCGSGVTACHNLLAMEVAGLGGSRLYPGSWSEWCADPARPVAKG